MASPAKLWLDIATGQLQGARARQEDSFLVRGQPGWRSALLGDGLGGHPLGDEASRVGTTMATARLLAWLLKAPPTDAVPLREIFGAADEAVRKLYNPRLHERPPASTLVGGVFFEGDARFEVACIGDSLTLMWREGRLSTLLEPQGSGNSVDHALGTGKAADSLAAVESRVVPVQAGDRFLLASDGIEVLSRTDIADLLKSGSAREAAEALLQAVIARREPMQDNCTVIVAVAHELK